MAANGTVAVGGADYADGCPQSNPDGLHLRISDGKGVLNATTAASDGEFDVGAWLRY